MSRNRIYAFHDDTPMPFGIYKGKELKDVPAYYLLYIYKNMDLYGGLRDYIKANRIKLEKRKQQEL